PLCAKAHRQLAGLLPHVEEEEQLRFADTLVQQEEIFFRSRYGAHDGRRENSGHPLDPARHEAGLAAASARALDYGRAVLGHRTEHSLDQRVKLWIAPTVLGRCGGQAAEDDNRASGLIELVDLLHRSQADRAR